MTRVLGPVVDDETRCVHYGSDLDVVAIRFFCCEAIYPCHRCHAETADRPARLRPADAMDEPAVLCGVCGALMTATEYLSVEACQDCAAPFNPGCAAHAHLYFDIAPGLL